MTFCQAPISCMPHHIDGMVEEQLTEQQKAPPTQGIGGSNHSYLVCANDHHQVAHMPAMGKLQWVAMAQTPMVEPPGMNMASSMVPKSRKQTPGQAPTNIIYKMVKGSTLKKKPTCGEPMV